MKNNALTIGAMGLLLLGSACTEKKLSPITVATPKKMERIHGFALQKRDSMREDGLPKPIKETDIYLKLDTLAKYVHQADTFKRTNEVFKTPFDSISFNKAIGYDYLGGEEVYWSVLNGYQAFIPTISNQKVLNWEQTKHFIAVVTTNSTYGGDHAMCFNPHFAVVLYHYDKPVFIVDVCLTCNSLVSTKKIPAMFSHKVHAGTEHEYSKIGFSDKGKQEIRQLCKQLNFHYGKQL